MCYVKVGAEINGFIHNQKENVYKEHYANIHMVGMNTNNTLISMMNILQKIYLMVVNKVIIISYHTILNLLHKNQ